MKFYNSVGPNPRMVRMFMAEKGFKVPTVPRSARTRMWSRRIELNIVEPAAWLLRMKARPSAAA